MLDKSLSYLRSEISNTNNDNSFRIFASYVGRAITLLACTSIISDSKSKDSLALELLGSVDKEGIWRTTADTGWALTALGEYFKGLNFGSELVNCNVKNAYLQ